MKQVTIYLTLLSMTLLTLGCSKGTDSGSGVIPPVAGSEETAAGSEETASAGEILINPDPDITFVEDPDISADLPAARGGRPLFHDTRGGKLPR